MNHNNNFISSIVIIQRSIEDKTNTRGRTTLKLTDPSKYNGAVWIHIFGELVPGGPLTEILTDAILSGRQKINNAPFQQKKRESITY